MYIILMMYFMMMMNLTVAFHVPKYLVKSIHSMKSIQSIEKISNRMILNAKEDAEVDIVDDNDNGFKLSESQCYLLLNSVALLYGTQHVCIKSSLDMYTSTSLVNFWRFFLSALLFTPSLFKAISSRIERPETIRAGIELGFYTFLGFAFQAIGLETTTASRSAFLLYLNVKFVPILLAVFFNRKINNTQWLSAGLAFCGTFLLSNDGAPPNIGDLWCIGAAIASAMYILRLEAFKNIKQADELNSISFITVASLCGVWVLGDFFGHHPELIINSSITGISGIGNTISNLLSQIITPFLSNPFPVIYLGVITTGICNYLQTLGQRKVPAEKAAVVYSMDPVYGAFFSRIFLDERLGVMGYTGAGLILCGVWLSARAALQNSGDSDGGDSDSDDDAITDFGQCPNAPKCRGEYREKGCDGNGKIQGGIATVSFLSWWPIKVYRPCPSYQDAGYIYRREGQTLDQVLFSEPSTKMQEKMAEIRAAEAEAAKAATAAELGLSKKNDDNNNNNNNNNNDSDSDNSEGPKDTTTDAEKKFLEDAFGKE